MQNFDNRGERAVLAEADGTNGTPMFLVQAQSTGTGSIPPDLNAFPGVAVNIHIAHGFEFPTDDYYCATANLDTHRDSPLTVERCSNSKEAKADKTQVFRYNKQTGVIQALRPTGSTSSNGALPTGPYRGRTLTFVPGVAKTEDGKGSSSSADVTTAANTATEAEAETGASAQSGSSTSASSIPSKLDQICGFYS